MLLIQGICALWMPMVLFFCIKKESERRCLGLLIIWGIMFVTSMISDTEVALLVDWILCAAVMRIIIKCEYVEWVYIPISYVMIVICSYTAEMVSIKVLGLGKGASAEQVPYMVQTMILSTVLIIVASFLLGKILEWMKKSIQSELKREILWLFGGNVFLCTVAFLINGWVTRQNEFTTTIATTNFVIFAIYMILTLAISIIVFKVHHEREKMENEKQQFESLQEYTSQIESMYTDLRAFKHDYVNILATLSGYLEAKDYDGMERYFNENILPESHKMMKDDEVNERRG